MKFDRVRLRNFKCYADADLELDPGVTVIHGLNGSGKSSLLEACFFGLYGATALDRTLEDVVTIGEEEAIIELWFTHDGGEFHVRRRIRATGERATTAECVLETPDDTVEGARDVRAEVTRLFRMDSEAFVNCAYVRQGEVNKLIHASPGERQDMIDDLLQLGALEDYRERASEARLGVKDVLDEVRGEATTLEEQIEAKHEKNLHERINELETERIDVVDDIEHFESQRESAVDTRESAQDVLETHEEVQDEIEALEAEVETLREKIAETESDRETAKERIADFESERSDLEERRTDLIADVSISENETIEERLDDTVARDEELRDDLEDVRVAITEATTSVDQHRETAENLDADAEDARERA